MQLQRANIQAPAIAALAATIALATPLRAATTVQIGDSGRTWASSTVQCVADPATGVLLPVVEAGLLNPKRSASAAVFLNDVLVAKLTSTDPSAELVLVGDDAAAVENTVVVALGKRIEDAYAFTVAPGACSTEGNTFSADGTLEYGASGKSYATVRPGCALNARTGLTQPYVHLFLEGSYVLNVSVDGVPLTQLSPTRPHTPVFLGAGMTVIAAANGSVSTDYYVRDGGDGTCVLAQ